MRPRCLFELNMVSFVGLIMPIANPNKTTHRLTVIVYKASRLGLKCRYQFPTRHFFFFFVWVRARGHNILMVSFAELALLGREKMQFVASFFTLS